ncbi:hypothetical protein L3X38_009892 [Prunus dulcis]|uniref:Uncharacterized protein n=1 Tax=Prunus dulcis TaxID=3755 RepID=A0AAD4WHA3_PRUDU|nr:hypothetical protein L3X38_009892 [Prunus dulcis]
MFVKKSAAVIYLNELFQCSVSLLIQETMGEDYPVALLQVLVDKLAHREVFKYFGLIKGVDQKLQKWTREDGGHTSHDSKHIPFLASEATASADWFASRGTHAQFRFVK